MDLGTKGNTFCTDGQSPNTTSSTAPREHLDPLPPLPQECAQPPRGYYLRLSNWLELNSFIALFRLKALPLTYEFISLCRDRKAPFKLPVSAAGAQQLPLWYKVRLLEDVSVAMLLVPLCMGIWRQKVNARKTDAASEGLRWILGMGNLHFHSVLGQGFQDSLG